MGTEGQRDRETVGTEEQRNSRNGAIEGTEGHWEQRDSRNRGTIGTEGQ